MSTISSAPFGKVNGKTVELFTLRNSNGCEVKISNYGGIITSITVPDKNGKMGDVALGYDNLDAYVSNNSPYFGAIVGRCANRIAYGRFTLDGKIYQLPTNNAPNHLHGGVKGFDKVVWNAKLLSSGLELTYLSKDGEEGYPGNLNVKAVYTLTDDNTLRLDLTANTDAATPCNLTQHSYFNLAGGGDILGHVLTIHADRFTPITTNLIPTGELRPVKGTPFDFTTPTAIGARINQPDEQLKNAGGYDQNFVLNNSGGKFALAARVTEPSSGRVMEVYTTEPGVQFYSGNFLDGSNIGKGGKAYNFRDGFCLEAQHFPDSPNHPEFPGTILKPGQTYKNSIAFKFSTFAP